MTAALVDVLGIAGCTAGVVAVLAAICAADAHVEARALRRAGRRQEHAVVREAEDITRTAAPTRQTGDPS